jgi:hypothetical protein
VLYQNRVSEAASLVAERGEEGAPWQYTTGEVTTGAVGVGFTVTVIADLVPSQTKVLRAPT